MSTTPPTADPPIRTVRGDIRPADLGFAHCHEHTFIRPGRSAQVDPALLLDDPEKTTAELTAFYSVGGRALVDAQPIGPERAPRWQRAASERSGVHIVATTGFHRAIYYPENHFCFSASADALAERMIAEVTDGMFDDGPTGEAEPTGIRAGLLKVATEYHVIDAHAQKVAEAVAAAHRQTGAPIITHTQRGTCGMEQIELFDRLGVDPSALLISHLDRNPDAYLHQDVAAAGALIVYDGISRAKYFPDSTLVELIGGMVQSGHERNILLAMDMGARTMWRSYGGGPGMTYLHDVFLPKLLRSGLDRETIDLFTTGNPARALAFRNVTTTV